MPYAASRFGIHVDLILAHEPAERSDLGDARNGLQVIAQVPILRAAQQREIVTVSRFGDQRVLKNPADAGGVGSEFRLHVLGQARQNLREILERARARPVNIRAFLEDDVDVRVAEIGEAAHVLHLRRAEHRADDRVGDLVLQDVRAAVPARVDDHLRVAQIGDCVERNLLHRPPARQRQRGHEQEDQEAVVRGELDDAVDHFEAPPSAVLSWLSESIRKLPEMTMRSPAFRPLRISVRPPFCAPILTSRGSK